MSLNIALTVAECRCLTTNHCCLPVDHGVIAHAAYVLLLHKLAFALNAYVYVRGLTKINTRQTCKKNKINACILYIILKSYFKNDQKSGVNHTVRKRVNSL